MGLAFIAGDPRTPVKERSGWRQEQLREYLPELQARPEQWAILGTNVKKWEMDNWRKAAHRVPGIQFTRKLTSKLAGVPLYTVYVRYSEEAL